MATILSPTDASVQQAARFLVSGGLVALPTETVYGLAADATSAEAVARIYAAKDRPATNPLIVHIADVESVTDFAEPQDERWLSLANAFWPGPLTLILPRRKGRIVDSVTAGKDTVGLRVPGVAITRRIIKEAGIPLAAPSANPAGYISPTTAMHVETSLGKRIEYIVDGGPCKSGIESTIIDLSEPGRARLLRPGPIGIEILEAVWGEPIERIHHAGSTEDVQVAPGQFSAHYQPRAKVILWEGPCPLSLGSKQAAVLYYKKPTNTAEANARWLSENGDPEEVAHNLYGVLRELDNAGFEKIAVELAPSSALSDSINDRLRRAAADVSL